MTPLLGPAAPVIEPADDLAQVVDARARDGDVRRSVIQGPISTFFGTLQALEQAQGGFG